jgi:hypothetical protein
MIGDGFTFLAFMKHLSQTYQHLDASHDTVAYNPVVYKHDQSKYSVDDIPLPRFNKPHQIGTVPEHLDPTKHDPAVRVDFRLTAAQLADFRQGVLGEHVQGHPTPPKLSLQDCLVATVSVCVSRADSASPPVRCVGTYINVSSTSLPL